MCSHLAGWGIAGNTRGKEQKERGAERSPLASSLLRPYCGQETYLSGPRLLLRKRSDVRVTSSVRLQVAWSISLPREARISAALSQGSEGAVPTATQDSGELTQTSAVPEASAPARPAGPVPAAGPGSRHPSHPENTGGQGQVPHPLPLNKPPFLPPGGHP